MYIRCHGDSPTPVTASCELSVTSSHTNLLCEYTRPVYEMLPCTGMTFSAYSQLLEDIGLEFDVSSSKSYKYHIKDVKKFMIGRLKYGI